MSQKYAYLLADVQDRSTGARVSLLMKVTHLQKAQVANNVAYRKLLCFEFRDIVCERYRMSPRECDVIFLGPANPEVFRLETVDLTTPEFQL